MATETPLVTILTDTKNRSDLIKRCIESIQKQTYRNYEHIIADGGNDNTEEVVKSYKDPHIIYIRVPDGGPVAQTKEAFNASKGSLITFLDDDDEYLPQKIEKQVELISQLPEDYGFIYGSMTYYDNSTGELIGEHKATICGGDLLDKALAAPIICGTPTLMFRRHVFEDIGGTWISGIGNEMSDFALVCKALSRGWKVGALKESYLKIYVNHGHRRMSDVDNRIPSAEKMILYFSYFLEEYKDYFNRNPKLALMYYINLLTHYMVAKRRKEGLSIWIKLMKVNPTLKNCLRLPFMIVKSFKSK